MKQQTTEGRKRPRLRLWSLMSITAIVILMLVIGSIILVCRTMMGKEYNRGLRRQMLDAADRLEQSGFSDAAISEVNRQGIQIMVLREADGVLLARSRPGGRFFRFDSSGTAGRQELSGMVKEDADNLRILVDRFLGSREGHTLVTHLDGLASQEPSRGKNLFLYGRLNGVIYSLYLPVEATSGAVDLTVRYATTVGVIGLLFSILITYLVSRAVTKPHRDIVQTAGKIAELDFSCRCAPSPVRELDELSSSVNTMADRLQSAVEELRNANEQLQRELEERKNQQRQNTEMLANLSHDLKTPIAIISGYAEGLQEGVAHTPEQQEKYYSMILTESEHMSRIVSRMLASTRLESDQIPLVVENFDMAVMLDEVLGLFRMEIQRLGLRLETDYDRPMMARTDYESIRQSVINYVQNAVYHINSGKLIRVAVTREDASLRLSVINSSAPIRSEEQSRIWEKLYRGDYARQRNHGEAGLGLAIVRGNMERLGLDYGCRNLDGELVEFWLCVPAVEQKPALAEDPPTA